MGTGGGCRSLVQNLQRARTTKGADLASVSCLPCLFGVVARGFPFSCSALMVITFARKCYDNVLASEFGELRDSAQLRCIRRKRTLCRPCSCVRGSKWVWSSVEEAFERISFPRAFEPARKGDIG